MARLTKVDGERALYKDPSSGTYFVRVYHNGTDTFRSLETTRIKEAIERMDARRAAKAAAKLGLTLEPDSAARAVAVADAIQRYVVDGYPDKRGRPRMRTEIEAANCVKLSKFFADGELVDNLTPNVLDKYHAWRIRTVKVGQGHRATDLELNTLNNALRWAVRKELVRINPIQSRSRYHSSREARHCRELAPANAEELHEIARLLFQSKRSETLGWQALFEANLGLRTGETLSMRMEARPDEAGGVTADGKSICVRRSKDPRGSEFRQPPLDFLLVENSSVIGHPSLGRLQDLIGCPVKTPRVTSPNAVLGERVTRADSEIRIRLPQAKNILMAAAILPVNPIGARCRLWCITPYARRPDHG